MKKEEILKIESEGINLAIVDNVLFISAEDSPEDNTLIQWMPNNELKIDGRTISSAMINVLTMYINKQI